MEHENSSKSRSVHVVRSTRLPPHKGKDFALVEFNAQIDVFIARDLIKMIAMCFLDAIRWRRYELKQDCGILSMINWK